ncbi:MAG TPA: hypothetical protein VGO11_09450 [Chthoniobacteraceae bacterium]|jgi:hypothetical protein|nr:hypothetical protein [Chthoniobacteraceae bacterium]
MDPYHVGNLDYHLGHILTDNMPDHGAAPNQVLEEYGHHVAPEDANYWALANGEWHTEGATGLHNVGHLMSSYGVPNHTVENATMDQLLDELHAGHRTIVSVADEHTAPPASLLDFFHSVQERLGLDAHGPKTHAVAIKEIDTSTPGHPQVILHDPAKADGHTVAYPMDEFVEAWKGSHFSYVATDVPPAHDAAHAHGGHHLTSDVVGLGTTAVLSHFGVPPPVSMAAGRLANTLTDKVWDHLLTRM